MQVDTRSLGYHGGFPEARWAGVGAGGTQDALWDPPAAAFQPVFTIQPAHLVDRATNKAPDQNKYRVYSNAYGVEGRTSAHDGANQQPSQACEAPPSRVGGDNAQAQAQSRCQTPPVGSVYLPRVVSGQSFGNSQSGSGVNRAVPSFSVPTSRADTSVADASWTKPKAPSTTVSRLRETRPKIPDKPRIDDVNQVQAHGSSYWGPKHTYSTQSCPSDVPNYSVQEFSTGTARPHAQQVHVINTVPARDYGSMHHEERVIPGPRFPLHHCHDRAHVVKSTGTHKVQRHHSPVQLHDAGHTWQPQPHRGGAEHDAPWHHAPQKVKVHGAAMHGERRDAGHCAQPSQSAWDTAHEQRYHRDEAANVSMRAHVPPQRHRAPQQASRLSHSCRESSTPAPVETGAYPPLPHPAQPHLSLPQHTSKGSKAAIIRLHDAHASALVRSSSKLLMIHPREPEIPAHLLAPPHDEAAEQPMAAFADAIVAEAAKLEDDDRCNDDQIAAETLIALVNMTPIKARHAPAKQRAGKGDTARQRKAAAELLQTKAIKRSASGAHPVLGFVVPHGRRSNTGSTGAAAVHEARPNKKHKLSPKKAGAPAKPAHTNAPAPPLPQHPPRPQPSTSTPSNDSEKTHDALSHQEEQSVGIFSAAHDKLAACMHAATAYVHRHTPELVSA